MIKPSPEKPLWTQKIASYPVALSLQDSSPNAGIIGIEGELYFFNVETGRMSKRLISHKGGNTTLASLSLSQEFVTGGEDGVVRIWGRGSQLPVWEHAMGKDWVDALATTPQGHFAAGAGRMLRVWNPERELIAERQFDFPVRQLQFLNHGKEFVISTPRKSHFLSLESGEEMFHVNYDVSPLKSCVSSDERWLAAGMADMGVRLFNLRSLTEEGLGVGPFNNKPKQLCWSNDSQLLAAANGDRVYLINRSILEELARDNKNDERDIRLALRPIDYVQGKTTALEFHGTEPWLAVATEDGNIVVEDLESRLRLFDVMIKTGPVVELHWTAESDRLIYATESGSVGCFWLSPNQLT